MHHNRSDLLRSLFLHSFSVISQLKTKHWYWSLMFGITINAHREEGVLSLLDFSSPLSWDPSRTHIKMPLKCQQGNGSIIHRTAIHSGKMLAVAALLHILFIIYLTWKCHCLSCDLSPHHTSMQIKKKRARFGGGKKAFLSLSVWNLFFFFFPGLSFKQCRKRRLNIDRQHARESGREGTTRSIFDEVDQSTATLAATTGVSAFLFKFNILFIFSLTS